MSLAQQFENVVLNLEEDSQPTGMTTSTSLEDDQQVLVAEQKEHNDVSTDENFTSTQSSAKTSHFPHYEYPPLYYKILIAEAKRRYADASEFLYSSCDRPSKKFDYFVTILKDLFTELDSPPSTLSSDEYLDVSILRRNIRHLQLNLEARRDLLRPRELSGSSEQLSQTDADEVVYSRVAASAKIARQRQLKTVILLEKINELKLQEMHLKQLRIEAEAELRLHADAESVEADLLVHSTTCEDISSSSHIAKIRRVRQKIQAARRI